MQWEYPEEKTVSHCSTLCMGLKRFYPNHFELSAITVDLGYEQCDFTPIKELCREMEIPYHIVKTDIAQILFEERKEKNPALSVPMSGKVH